MGPPPKLVGVFLCPLDTSGLVQYHTNMSDPPTPHHLKNLAEEAHKYTQWAKEARQRLHQAVVEAITHHGMPEREAARITGLARNTIRDWLGK